MDIDKHICTLYLKYLSKYTILNCETVHYTDIEKAYDVCSSLWLVRLHQQLTSKEVKQSNEIKWVL